MRPDPAILERNLERLLRRAYQPALPRPEFRAALKSLVLAQLDQRAPTPSLAKRRVARVAVLLAASLLVVLGARWLFDVDRSAGPEGPPSLGGLLARGAVALRDAPDGPWRAADPGGTDYAGGYLEIRTPASMGIDVRHAAFRIGVGPDGRAALDAAAGALPRVALLDGRLVARVDAPPPQALAVTTRAGLIELGAGNAVLTYAAPPSVAGSTPGARDGVHLELDSATARVGATELAPGSDVYVSDGRVSPWSPEPTAPRRVDTDTTRAPAPDDAAAPRPDEDRGTVSVRVRDARSGEPLREFRVALLQLEITLAGGRRTPAYQTPPLVRAIVDEEGRASLPLRTAGSFKLYVDAAAHGTWRSDTFLGGPDTGAIEYEAALSLGVEVSGVVRDGATGEPLKNAIVLSETDMPMLFVPVQNSWLDAMGLDRVSTVARTDDAGRFRLADLAPGVQSLRASAPGYAPSTLRLEGLAPGAGSAEVGFDLRAGSVVFGQVREAAGRPTAGAFVIAAPQRGDAPPTGAPVGLGITDSDGRYRIEDLPDGACVVLLTAPDSAESGNGGGDAEAVRSAQLVSGEETRVDFLPPELTLRGRLLEADGTPRAGAMISVLKDGASDFLGAMTGTDGGFEVVVPAPGAYTVTLVEGPGTTIVRLAETMVRADSPPLDLHLRGAWLGGVVRAEQTQEGVARAVVVLLAAQPGAEPSFVGKTIADATGRYRLGPLPAGIYRVLAQATSGGLAATVRDGVQIGPGQDEDGVDVLLAAGGALELTFLDPDGRPVAGVGANVVCSNGYRFDAEWAPRADARGVLRLEGIPDGDCTIHPVAPGYRLAPSDGADPDAGLVAHARANATVRVTIRLEHEER